RLVATYAELHAHSGFSFLDGASDPEELAAEATRLQLSGLALTDHHGLYGGDDRVGVRDPTGEHLVVLARSPEGYRHLAVMLGEAHLRRGEKGAPRFSLDEIANAAREWLILTGCRKGPLTRA